MAYLEELLPEFRKGAKIRCDYWDEGKYIQLKEDGYIYDEDGDGCTYDLNMSLIADDWEVVPDKPIDWDYIINNKCLCWFWCGIGKIKYLNYLQVKEEHTFRDELGSCWDNCRPVRRDEVTFYEDKKDEI